MIDHIKEQLNNNNLSVRKHITTCQGVTISQNIDAKIIAQENNPVNLLIILGILHSKVQAQT